ncbi:hypothetical protein GCM10010187_44760 [Actinomadura coerulea]|nr:hypothetical protein GCM10010187_44760 [Actinomadura coerulea]
MVVPFGSALERRSRTTYRPTVTPEGSTHVDTRFTGTTSSFSGTASEKVSAPPRPANGFYGVRRPFAGSVVGAVGWSVTSFPIAGPQPPRLPLTPPLRTWALVIVVG